MTTIPQTYICSDTCMTGIVNFTPIVPTLSDSITIDERAIHPPSKLIEITLPDGTVVKIYARENAIHIIRPDGSTLDERLGPKPKAPR